MAIRFEPNCDEKVKWPSSNLYPSSGGDSRPVSATSPLDLRYNVELSDQDDRRTSSCSPYSCDESISATPVDFVPALPYSSSKSVDLCAEKQFAAPGWNMPTAFNSSFYKTPVVKSKRFKTTSSAPEERDWNENKTLSPSNLFVRSKFSPKSLYPCTFQASRDQTETKKSSGAINLKQNGCQDVASTSASVDKIPDQRFFIVGGIPSTDFKDKKWRQASAVNDILQVDTENTSNNTSILTCKSERFGDTDAAEALLGLSEGFYQSSNSIEKHPNVNEEMFQSQANGNGMISCKSSNSAANRYLNSENGAKSKFHYKKRIFQKYVNSQVEPENTNFSKTTSSNRANDLKVDKHTESACESDAKRTFFAGKPSFAMSSSENTKLVFNSFQYSTAVAGKLAVKTEDLTNANTNCKAADSFHAELNHCKGNALKVINLNGLQSSMRHDKSFRRSSSGKSVAESEKTNLYRISAALGSSNESLSPSVNDPSEDLGSESESSESSSSESTDECDDFTPCSHLPAATNKELFSTDVSKRKVVLNKPKFSLPNLKNDDKHTYNKLFKKQTEAFDSSCKSTSDTKSLSHSGNLLTSNEVQTTFGNANTSTNETSKQNEIRIKKATFTFSSAKKVGKVEQQNGLSVTSHPSALADQTRSVVKDKNSFRFDKDKLDSGEAKTPTSSLKQSNSPSAEKPTFGRFSSGDSFETLSKPNQKRTASKAKKNQRLGLSKHGPTNIPVVPYDKNRLPRPSARSAALEAQQVLMSKTGRKRKLTSLLNDSKPNSKLTNRSAVKRFKLETDPKNRDSRLNSKSRHTQLAQSHNHTTDKSKQNGDASSMETNLSSGKLSIERSSSRRKPKRVFKHQKYTSVSMMSSNHCPRDSSTSSEFAIISKPLNLDHRVLLANSIDLCRGSPVSTNSNASSPIASSGCSSRTSSVAGDDKESEVGKKSDNSSVEKNRSKRNRHLSAIETNLKSELLKQKHKVKRLLSVNEEGSRGNCGRHLCPSLLTGNWRRSLPQYACGSFQLLSLFPAPASIKPGFAQGELLPGYGPTVSGQRSSLPLRWSKGRDVRDLKQKRQREKWRKMSLNMFCMGASS